MTRLRPTLTRPPQVTRDWTPANTLLQRGLAPAIAIIGPVAAVALLASLTPDQAAVNLLMLLAAVLAAAGGTMAGLDLHRRAIEAESRGVSVEIGARAPGVGTSFVVALAILIAVLGVLLGVEVAGELARGDEVPGPSSGSTALADAIERRAIADELETSSGSTAERGPLGPSPGRSNDSAQSSVALGDLLSGREALMVRPYPGRNVGLESLHLRGFVLDTYDQDGRLRSLAGDPRPVTDAADGRDDGWIEWSFPDESPVGASSGQVLEVDYLGRSNGLVFSPNRLVAVGAERAGVVDVQSAMFLEGRSAERYRVRYQPLGLEYSVLDGANARSADRVGLPGDPGGGGSRAFALRSLTAYAERLTQDASSDLDRVLAVVRHFRTRFTYELYDTSFLDTKGVRGLIDRGSGSCTHFASASVLMLRLLDIPARAAAGYVARETTEAGDGWICRERDAHAWIEVHFDGLGWLPFDPTPGDPSVGGSENGWTPLADESVVTGNVGSGVGRGTTRLGQMLVSAVATGLGAIGGIGPALVLFLVVILGLWVLGRMTSTATDPSAAQPEPLASSAGALRSAPPSAGADRLLAAIRARGWQPQRGETPSRFASGLEEAHPAAAGLTYAMRTLLRRACTQDPLTEAEEAAMMDLADRIETAEAEATGTQAPAGPSRSEHGAG